eukprot:TRINITY_DN16526_c0_g1_i1.p1 TRINITY_DN16526_c0_g1~~TRINITY_DN16526_c0_g1_i1.p1  ORF type:complete len:204 (-),score=16.18 TRINITY_DN16526_c0_g1_i1:3-614(-)
MSYTTALGRLSVLVGVVSTSIVLLWYALVAITGSSSPLMVNVSGASMHHNRGDLIFTTLSTHKHTFQVGELVVFRRQPDLATVGIMHRVVRLVTREERDVKSECGVVVGFVTKGDDNIVDDRGLYPNGHQYLPLDAIIAYPLMEIPYAGLLLIAMQDYSWFFSTLFACVCICTILRPTPSTILLTTFCVSLFTSSFLIPPVFT